MTDASRLSGPSADSSLPESGAAPESPGGETEPPRPERKTRGGLRSLFRGRSDDSAKANRADDASAAADAPWGSALAGPRDLEPDDAEPRDRYAALRSIRDDEDTDDAASAPTGRLGGSLGLRDLDRDEPTGEQRTGFDPSLLADPPDFEFRGFDLPEDPPAPAAPPAASAEPAAPKPPAADRTAGEPADPSPSPSPSPRPRPGAASRLTAAPEPAAEPSPSPSGGLSGADLFAARRDAGSRDRDAQPDDSYARQDDGPADDTDSYRDSDSYRDDYSRRENRFGRGGGFDRDRDGDNFSGYARDDSGEPDFGRFGGTEQPSSSPYAGSTASYASPPDTEPDRYGSSRRPSDSYDAQPEHGTPQQRQAGSYGIGRSPAGYAAAAGVGSGYAATMAAGKVPNLDAPPDAAANENWWAADAQRDPWRDPESAPAWMAPPLPAPPAPRLPIRLAPPRQAKAIGGQLVAVALFAALLAGLLGGALGYVVAANTVGPAFSLGSSASGTPALAKRPPGSIAGIAQRIQPSVVTIDIRSATGTGNGSGFIISKNGHILTNNHVAEPGDAAGGSLTVVFHDGTTAPARIIGRDAGSDVAVLKVEKTNLPAVQFADSDKASVGDPVIAFGSPLGLNGTVTTGIISAMERPVKTGGREGGEEAYMAAIQTDAAINPGNSGGPLVDGDGRVLGIDSAIATIPGETGKAGSIGLGFAIPMNQAKRTAEQLIASGKATTTVIGADLDRDTKLPTGGVRITSVPDGPAKAAGLRPGDVIVRLNNRVIGDAVDLIALVRKLPPGTKASLVYTRGGRPATTSITLGAKTVN